MFTFCMRSALCVIVVKVTVIDYSVVFVRFNVFKLKIQLCDVYILYLFSIRMYQGLLLRWLRQPFPHLILLALQQVSCENVRRVVVACSKPLFCIMIIMNVRIYASYIWLLCNPGIAVLWECHIQIQVVWYVCTCANPVLHVQYHCIPSHMSLHSF